MADVQFILRRLDRMRSERQTFDSHWQEVADHIIPSREFSQRRSVGEKRNTRIFDTTATLACEQLAGALHGMLTSPAVRWFALRAQDEALADNDEVKAWFEEATQTLYDNFNSPTAAFSTNSHEMYLDVAAFGTGVMFVADRGRLGVSFRAVPLSECYMAEGPQGTIDTLFRGYSIPARNAVALWGKDAVGKAINDLIEKTPDAPVKLVHAVYPRPDEDRAYGGNAAKRMPFANCYVHLDSKHVIEEGGFKDFPFVSPRWSLRSSTGGECSAC